MQVREATHHGTERVVAQDAGGAQERVQEASPGPRGRRKRHQRTHHCARARQSGSFAAEDVLLEQLREEELRCKRHQGKLIRLEQDLAWYRKDRLQKKDDPDPGTRSRGQKNNLIRIRIRYRDDATRAKT
jgi:hypothetical protein